MTKKLFIFGIDSLDSILLERFSDRLPTFRTLMLEGSYSRTMGVFPPDSPTSWASIFTGLSPAKHGVVHFMDPLEKSSKLMKDELDNSGIIGRTFWDILGKSGKKSYILFPLLGYPTWKINGLMVGRATTSNNIEFNPERKTNGKNRKLDNLKGLPGLNPTSFIERGSRLLENEIDFALNFISEEWDLFFLYSSVLDPIQHNFWNCYDETDPTHDSDGKFQDVIESFYIEYDNAVKRLLSKINDDVDFMIISDHGHMRRPIKSVAINMKLHEMGYFKPRSNGENENGAERFSSIKLKTANIIAKYNLGNIAAKLMRNFPQIKDIFVSSDMIDWENTIAHASDLSGIKAYTYGGIIIRREIILEKGLDYEEIREEIIHELSNLNDTEGSQLVKWIKKREKLYEGPLINRYPDIVFELIEDYGIGWSYNGDLIRDSNAHNVHPGSHRQETPVLILRTRDHKLNLEKDMNLMDIAPTILDITGVEWRNYQFDGRSCLL